jgi:hypothetical protein
MRVRASPITFKWPNRTISLELWHEKKLAGPIDPNLKNRKRDSHPQTS